jgi:hypothetical protein
VNQQALIHNALIQSGRLEFSSHLLVSRAPHCVFQRSFLTVATSRVVYLIASNKEKQIRLPRRVSRFKSISMFTSSSVIFVYYSTPLYLYNPDLITFKKTRLSTLKMDQFLYLDKYRVLICKQCAYTIPQTYLTSHLKRHLHEFCAFENQAALSALEKQLRGLSLLDPPEESVVFPDPNRPPLPEVPLHNDLSYRDCLYITTSLAWIKQHAQIHQPIKKGR